MSRFKLFVENFLVYGLGGIISKLVPLIMLPIITRLMPNTFYFGLNDLSNTVVSFGSAIAILGMYDAMFRMFFDKEDEEYKKDICSSALGFTIITSLIVFLVLIIFRKYMSQLVFSDVRYQNLLFLTAVSILIGSTNSIVAAPTRMQNNKVTYLTANIMGSLISYGIAVVLLVKGYYIIALPLGSIISVLSLELFFFLVNKKWFRLSRIRVEYVKKMLLIGLPLVPNFLVYWIFNSCDRLMIAKMLGNEYTGIYAVGAKVAQISQMIYTAFAGGWQYFAFSTMEDGDQVKMTSNIFEYLGIISFAAGMLMAAFSYPIFHLFFKGDYVQGYIVAPWLFIAPLVQMLFQVIGNQFLVIKKTWPSMLILASGAILNVIINFFFIPKIGIEGAAWATLGGYIVSVVACIIVLKKMKLVDISLKFYGATLCTCIYLIIWRLVLINHIILSICVALGMILINGFLYREPIKKLFAMVKTKERGL